MKATAIATFRTKLRPDTPGTVLVRPGDVLDADVEHIQALARNRLVVVEEEEEREVAVALAPETPEQLKPRRGKGDVAVAPAPETPEQPKPRKGNGKGKK